MVAPVIVGLAVLLACDGGVAVAHPDWSPDGRHLAFEGNRNGARNIYIMKSDGTEVRQLTTGTVTNSYPIVFRSYLDGTDQDGEIMLVDAAGRNITRLTDNTVEDGYPAFLSDGRKIYFHREIAGYRQVIALDLATGAEEQCISFGAEWDQIRLRHEPRRERPVTCHPPVG